VTGTGQKDSQHWRGFQVVDGCLAPGGVPLPRLAARVGQTPFFAYDRALVSQRVAELREHLPDDVALNYAVKANPMPALVQHLAGLVDGFDLASAGEMMTALDTTMPAERISFAGPGKTRDELGRAVAAGITVNVESERELETLNEIGRAAGQRPRVAIRVNPDFELRGSGMRMGGGAKQFGIDAERVPQALRWIGQHDFEFLGFHIFSGSQGLNAAAITEAQSKTIDLAIELSAHAPSPVRKLNIGGGFGIPYFDIDVALDLAAVGQGLAEHMPRARAKLPEAQVMIELGRYIVGEAGVYVCRIVDRKESRGQVFLITDGGLHHQLAASGNFGQVLRRNYPVAIGNRIGQGPDETATVVGCLCTPLDLLASKMDLPHAEVGDFVVIFQSGAYGLTASPTAFLSHPQASEVLV
jgi:diaminopimelate decarboxylase